MTTESKSQTKAPLHISLTKWSTVQSVIPAINDAYEMRLDPDNYENRIAISNEYGVLSLSLVLKATGELDWVIIDRESSTVELQMGTIKNPKAFLYEEVKKSFSVLINTEAELGFLKNQPIDRKYDSGLLGADKSRILSNLLNTYMIGDGWSANPGQGCSTAYFVLRYYGSGANAPDVYNFNRDARLLVVVELMMYGEYQTHALVVR